METIKELYIIPTYSCNLDCPHCELHRKVERYNESIFISRLKTLFFDRGILFGGEPLLLQEKLIPILETKKISSISTNLLLLNATSLKLIKDYDLDIATSWNQTRFTPKQFDIWIDNLKLLEQYNLSCIILITLTEDLINCDYNTFLTLLSELDKIKSITGIKFEQLVDNSKKAEFYERVDNWLCKISKDWSFSFKNLLLENLNDWNCDCSKTYTLTPSGILKKGCPQYTQTNVLQQCLSCKLANVCKPCILQKECSFPKKLYESYKNVLYSKY